MSRIDDRERQTNAASSGGRHLLLFDGVCALCNGIVQFVLARDRRRVFDFAPLQGPTARQLLGRFGADPTELDTLYIVRTYRSAAPSPLTRAQAALFLLQELGWPWKAGTILRILPGAWLDAGYNLIARNRYRVFGRYEQCSLPRPEDKDRFIDEEGPETSPSSPLV